MSPRACSVRVGDLDLYFAPLSIGLYDAQSWCLRRLGLRDRNRSKY